MVRKETTHFFWTSRRDEVDCRLLQNDQIVNHYANAAAFATKVADPAKMFPLAAFPSPFLLSRWGCA